MLKSNGYFLFSEKWKEELDTWMYYRKASYRTTMYCNEQAAPWTGNNINQFYLYFFILANSSGSQIL